MDQQLCRRLKPGDLGADVVHRLEDLRKREYRRVGALGDRAGEHGGYVIGTDPGAHCDHLGRDYRSALPIMNQSKFAVWLKLWWMFLKVNILSSSGHACYGLMYKA